MLEAIVLIVNSFITTNYFWEKRVNQSNTGFFIRNNNFSLKLNLFAFALGQKALRSPGFPKCFSEVFLGELIKFFFFFFWNPWPILCSACNQDRPDFPGEMGLKPENKSLLPNFSESLFLKHMTIVTVENLSAWHERGGRHCWKSWSKHKTPS